MPLFGKKKKKTKKPFVKRKKPIRGLRTSEEKVQNDDILVNTN